MDVKYVSDFENLRDQLKSFVFRLVTNTEDAEDIVQDTFVKVQQNIHSFRGESSFKTWVFSIATNIAKNHLAKSKRWTVNTQDYGAMLHVKSDEHWSTFTKVFESTPDKNYEIAEHIAYCFNCISKTLLIEQQVCLLLKDVYDFKIEEVIEITSLSEGRVKHAIADARKNMTTIFDNRCAFVNKNGICHQCTTLKGLLNPEQNAHIAANRIKMVKDGHNADKQYLFDLRLELVKAIDPLNSPNAALNTFMLASAEKWVQQGIEKKVL